MDLSPLLFPTAVLLGALHALEPGHAKTLTAAYLLGTKGTPRDAIVLGLSVATTHSIIVVGLALVAVVIGRESFTEDANYLIALASGAIVTLLGCTLVTRRLSMLRRSPITPCTQQQARHYGILAPTLSATRGDHHHHEHLSDDEHARAHAAQLPAYVHRGERPTLGQIVLFGAAGGLVPCPAAVSVMLLSLTVRESFTGLLLVAGFSLGLAVTLVGIGLLVVSGIGWLSNHQHFSGFSRYAPLLAAAMVVVSGVVAIAAAVLQHG